MTRSSAGSGFTLAELVLAIGTIAACILTVLVLLVSLTRSSRKSVDLSASEIAAEQIIARILYDAQYNDHANFWGANSAASGFIGTYRTGTWDSNNTTFSYSLDADTIMDATTSLPVGHPQANNHLKTLTLHMTWWDGNVGDRAGYGKLKREVTRVVHEEP